MHMQSAKIHTHITIYLFIGSRVKAIKWKIALSSFDFNITFYNAHENLNEAANHGVDIVEQTM